MLKEIMSVKTALMFLLVFTLFSPGVFAQGYERGGWGGHGVYYNHGRWYRHGWMGWGVRVPVLTSGVYVDTLPPNYAPVIVQGQSYYYGDNMYFRRMPAGGYTVVTIH